MYLIATLNSENAIIIVHASFIDFISGTVEMELQKYSDTDAVAIDLNEKQPIVGAFAAHYYLEGSRLVKSLIEFELTYTVKSFDFRIKKADSVFACSLYDAQKLILMKYDRRHEVEFLSHRIIR